MRYLLSHDPAQRCVGIALFDRQGTAYGDLQADEPIGAEVVVAAREFGILVLSAP